MGYVRLPFPDKKRGRKYFQQFVFKTFKTRPSESNLILCLWSGVPAMLRQLVLGNQFLCEPSLHNLTKSDQAGQLGGKNRLFNHRASGCYSETIFNTKLIEDNKTSILQIISYHCTVLLGLVPVNLKRSLNTEHSYTTRSCS